MRGAPVLPAVSELIDAAVATGTRAAYVEVDTFERGSEAIGIALPAHFAVGDDVEARALLVANGQDGRIVDIDRMRHGVQRAAARVHRVGHVVVVPITGVFNAGLAEQIRRVP